MILLCQSVTNYRGSVGDNVLQNSNLFSRMKNIRNTLNDRICYDFYGILCSRFLLGLSVLYCSVAFLARPTPLGKLRGILSKSDENPSPGGFHRQEGGNIYIEKTFRLPFFFVFRSLYSGVYLKGGGDGKRIER